MKNLVANEMNRRKFLETSLLAFFAGLSVTWIGCDESSTGPDPIVKAGTVSGAHSHTVGITQAQLNAGVGVTLTLTGSGHSHQLILSTADMTTLIGGQSISVDSMNGGSPAHFHTVTFT